MKKPWVSGLVLGIILMGCFLNALFIPYDPTYMDLANCNVKPNSDFYFGTDSMGRDIFSMIWYGGKISLYIGILATVLSTGIAVVYGSISGMAGEKADAVMMHFIEIALSIPSILMLIFVQAMMGKSNPTSIALVIGMTGWMNIAKVIRSEVRQVRSSEYVIASYSMNAGFFHVLRWHLIPNFIPAVMFMVVTNIGQAIGIESTLSFLGIGLPIEIISWGSMLSLSEQALLSNSWWVIIIPGIFLVVTLVSITDLGNYIRTENYKRHSNL